VYCTEKMMSVIAVNRFTALENRAFLCERTLSEKIHAHKLKKKINPNAAKFIAARKEKSALESCAKI